ncbi:MAG: hypothetical protein K2Y22_16015 [Candidatus Obscuribacterales bacterium]|nr:hypothetical protein [Candidatus Obscuribacterales bacterium]
MKLLRVFLFLVIIAQFSFMGQPALADTAAIDSGFISKLEANVQSLGNLQFGKARAEISDNRMDIFFTVVDLATSRLSEEKSLTGIILTSKTLGEGSARNLTGGVYFDGGHKLHELDTTSPEYIKTTKGQTVTGKITQVSRVQLSIETSYGTEDFLISELAEIHSPKYFQFSIPIADATGTGTTVSGQVEEMSFCNTSEVIQTVEPGPVVAEKPVTTDKPVTIDKHHSRGALHAPSGNQKAMSTKAKIITFTVLGCVIATAIAVPIAVACGTSGGGSNRQQVLRGFAWQQFLAGNRW